MPATETTTHKHRVELLRFTTAGSVDDGKSTLIGRLLYDSKSIFEDQMEALERTRDITGEGQINLANLYKASGELEKARPIGAELPLGYRKRAEASADARSKNSYAWEALTIEPVDLRDPESALRFAIDANELTGFENPNYLDTLSLAYHMTGDTAKAIENQKKAISLLPEESPGRTSYEEALEKFRAALAEQD